MTSQLCRRATAAPNARASAMPSAPYGETSAGAAAAEEDEAAPVAPRVEVEAGGAWAAFCTRSSRSRAFTDGPFTRSSTSLRPTKAERRAVEEGA